MPDQFTRKKRSEIMRAVKSGGNETTEIELTRQLKAKHIIGWRRHYPAFGKPDIVFLKQRVAVFADGCFWHGHNCRNLSPRHNATYWQQKISRNKNRDIQVRRTLRKAGWRVVRLWECRITIGQIGNLLHMVTGADSTSHRKPLR